MSGLVERSGRSNGAWRRELRATALKLGRARLAVQFAGKRKKTKETIKETPAEWLAKCGCRGRGPHERGLDCPARRGDELRLFQVFRTERAAQAFVRAVRRGRARP